MRHVRSFMTVAHEGSLTKAAQVLCVSQSALSITIQDCEEDLGLVLFDRTTRRLELTQAGRDFLPLAEGLLRDFDGVLRRMRALGRRERGSVGVAAVPSVMSLLLPEVVASYIDAFPGIDVYLREDNSRGVQQRIVSGDVDFGISSLWVPDGNLEFEPLFSDRYGVVSAPDHQLSEQTDDVPWSVLDSFLVIGFSMDLGMQRQLSDMPGVPERIRNPHYQVSNTATIEMLLRRCGGISVMSALAAQRPPLDQLCLRLLSKPVCDRTVGLLTRRGRAMSPAAAELLRLIRESVPRLMGFRGIALVSRSNVG
jgi:DNA-binding transcriptional LysR family regulator